MDSRSFKIGDVIQHFKRETYKIEDEHDYIYLYMFLGIATHTETKEKFAIYTSLYTNKKTGVHFGEIFARPYDMFMSEVDKEKYPNIKQKYRFEKYENN